MKLFDTDIQKYAEKVRLTAAEKRALRERLVSYMEYHPLPKQEGMPSPFAFESEPFAVLTFSRRAIQLGAGLFALMLVILPVAAERSVPGEVLYLVKTGVNEPVQAQFATSPYEKIEFETKLVERRVAEARVLASEGKLTEEVQSTLAETVKTHTQNVATQIAELRAQDADGAAIAEVAYNASLEVQTAVLNAEGAEAEAAPTGPILAAVNAARDEAAVVAEEAEKPSYESILARVEEETEKAETLFETVKKSATDGENRSIERRLSDINRQIADMKAAHERITEATPDRDVHNAQIARFLSKTLGSVQKLTAFMSTVDVRETVALDTLVPVMLSDEERLAAVNEQFTTLTEARLPAVDAALADVTDSGVVDKVRFGQEQADAMIAQMHTLLDEGNLDGAETTLADLEALVTDMELLTTDTEEVPTTDPVVPSPDATSTATTTDDGIGDSGTTSAAVMLRL